MNAYDDPQVDSNELLRRHQQLPRHFGQAFVVVFYRAYKGAAFYDRQNATLRSLIRELHWTIHSMLTASDQLEIKIIRDACFCNTAIIRAVAEHFSSYTGFVQALRQREIGELHFSPSVTEEDLTAFIFLLRELSAVQDDPCEYLAAQLLQRGLVSIEVGKLDIGEERMGTANPADVKRQAKSVYFSSLGVTKELMEGTKDQTLSLRKAKRLMFSAVDLITRDESALLGLTSIKSYDDYTFTHCVNVALYAIAMGNRLRLSKRNLSYLGIAGLFHDLGKTLISHEILDKPGALTPEEWDVIRTHPASGARLILQMKGWGPLASRMLAASFEHHIKYDLTGYPAIAYDEKPSLFSRIITIADVYDALARPRVYRKTAFVTEKILAVLRKDSGTHFDPTLVKVFINMVGIYPLGALVQLNTGVLAVVTKISPEPDMLLHPQICLLEHEGETYRKGIAVDLSERDTTGHFPHSIARTLDPNDYGINLEELAL
ncbi:MAG TPA: HD-GYP domain-containing protein [Armatimonadota bacterium]|jgi:HD-GYP domain-containing protein (c-di-GMP phosphodiesterase class II)